MVISESVRSPNGIGRSEMPFTMLNTVTLAPMPMAPRKRSVCGAGWMYSIASTIPTPNPYHASRRRTRGRSPSRVVS